MASQDSSAEERIILATVSCIERQGLRNVTIRSIAAEAGVNSAAINYYFRSKEKLVAMAMKMTLDHLFEDLEAIVEDDSLSPPERAAEMLDYLIDGATRYPGVTRAHIEEAMSGNAMDSPFAKRMNDVLGRLKERLEAAMVRTEDGDTVKSGAGQGRELDMRLVSLLSAAMMPAIMPTFYREFSGIDFRDSRTRKSYVRSIMRGLGGAD